MAERRVAFDSGFEMTLRLRTRQVDGIWLVFWCLRTGLPPMAEADTLPPSQASPGVKARLFVFAAALVVLPWPGQAWCLGRTTLTMPTAQAIEATAALTTAVEVVVDGRIY